MQSAYVVGGEPLAIDVMNVPRRMMDQTAPISYDYDTKDPTEALLSALEDAMDNLDSWVNAYHKGKWVRFWRLTDGTWRAKTTGSKGGPYSLVISDRHLSCTCEGFKYRNICKHAARLAVKLQKQGVDIAEEIVKPVADGEAA